MRGFLCGAVDQDAALFHKGLNAVAAEVGKLRGKEGTPVTLTIQRDTSALPAPITIVRAKIHQLSVYEKMLPGKIGYVALTVFGRDTGDELTTALDRLQQNGARALVLDLRDNGGGYLEAAVAVHAVQRYQLGKLLHTRNAPRGPEIDEP